MHVERSNERDSGWEDHAARYRVYLFTPSQSPSVWSTETWDLTDTDASAALQWAQEHEPPDGLHAVALVREDPTRGSGVPRGLVWLVGMDANDRPRDADEERLKRVMLNRRRPGAASG